MKIRCEKVLLMQAIQTTFRAVASRSSIPALEGILFHVQDEMATLTGYDLEVGIFTSLPVEMGKPGSVVVAAKLLADIVRRLPDLPVTLSLDERYVLTIECGEAHFEIASCLPADTYPDLPAPEKSLSFSLLQAQLRQMVSDTLFAVSTNETKQVHTGALFTRDENKFSIVGVDGFRLALRRMQGEEPPFEKDFVIPGKALRELEKLLNTDEESQITLSPGLRHIYFTTPDMTLVTRLLEGNFLNYRAAIPSEYTFKVTSNTKELIQCVERVSLMVSEKVKNPVRMTVTDKGVALSCLTTMGRAEDFCPAQVLGEVPLEIGFNDRYLLDALRVIETEDVVIQTKGPLSPCLFIPSDSNGDAVYMVLPVRLKADA